MKDIHQKLLATFQVEHRDHVEQIRSLLAAVEKTEAPPARPDLEEIFRRAHSLKGAARAVDLSTIEELAHRLETLFSRVLQGVCALDGDVNRVVQQVLDASEDCIAATNPNQSAETVGPALRAIGTLIGIQTQAAAEQAPVVETPVSVPAFQPLDMVRITAENFDGLFRTVGSLVTESQLKDQVSEELDQLARGIVLLEKESEQASRAADGLRHSDASREFLRLTSLLTSITKQARSLSRKARAVRSLHQRRSWTLRQLGKRLRQDVSRARMVPAESLLEGYRKMMRDLAREEGSEIEFRVISAGVHADRRVLEALKDPLMHLLRNAVSHGIEPVPERLAKGKPRAGLVTLRLDTDGQRLTIAIEDDGRGVDLSRVAEVAAREGILSASEATPDKSRELTRILFLPGFSTSATVTSLSGRGMGLSVVHEAVLRLQGEVNLQSTHGGGTTISLSVPLSIASHRLVIVNCAGQIFAIPVLGIERLLRIRRESIETVEGNTVIVFKGKPVPLLSLLALLDLEDSAPPTAEDTLQVVVMRSSGQRIGLAVDSVLREADAVIQSLTFAAGCGGRISSGVVLDDGVIAFVINPAELLEGVSPLRVRRQSFVKSPGHAAEKASSNILVVDDSLTTRALEKSILEAHGYAVRIAVDGVDALARLREESADLVIADVEMPRLNGFGLIDAMKKDSKLEKIPVIIVSSLDRREDRERGLSLGADAYIVKRKFDQEELLAAIRQIL